MLDHLATREGDFPARRPFKTDRRSGARRRQHCDDPKPWQERRARAERRLDADWRFAVIRRWMAVALSDTAPA